MSQRFNEAASSAKEGDAVTIPGIIGIAGVDDLLVTLKGQTEKGLKQFIVTWYGIYMGTLYGKPEKSVPGWKFYSVESKYVE